MTWDSDPAYDGDTPDKYVFTADVDGYALAGVEPPQITVTVTEEAVETSYIIRWLVILGDKWLKSVRESG